MNSNSLISLSRFLIGRICLTTVCAGHTLHAGTAQELYSFKNGDNPSSLIAGPDGAFYGTTSQGGPGGYGSVFRVTTNGTLTTLVTFAKTNGANPETGLILGKDNFLYGTTSAGGTNGNGTVFRVTTGGVLTTLVTFSGDGGLYQGRYPRGLVQGADGGLYGPTYYGGGQIFRVGTNGSFWNVASYGGLCEGLAVGPDNALYGTASATGPAGYGVVFRVTTNGALQNIAYFDGTNGIQPSSRLMFASDGAMYGTAYNGGTNGINGTIYKCTTNGVLYRFSTVGQSQSRLVEAGGAFYCTTLGGIYKVNTSGSASQIFAFNGANGSGACLELALGADGLFYGTTARGGTNDSGVVFKITTNGNQTVLTPFTGQVGGSPQSGLIQASDGWFYGTISKGGSFGKGGVYRISSNGAYTLLASFGITNGATPNDGLVEGVDGALYGTTSAGGAVTVGTVFRITKDGVLNTLGSFGFTNGYSPHGTLVRGPDGVLYGTTALGGTYGIGVVFKVPTGGPIVKIADLTDSMGSYPNGVIFGPDGALYGTTAHGGSYDGGTIFRVTTTGDLSVLASLDPGAGKGAYSQSQLLLGYDGAFYGTTYRTSTNNSGYGTVFRVSMQGAFTNLCVFTNIPGPAYPTGPLIQGSDGALYGSTISGGTSGAGALYRVTSDGMLTTLVSFDAGNGQAPRGLLQANDGRFYGTCSAGGKFLAGNVFAVSMISQMKPLQPAGNEWVVGFEGVAGNTYRLQRATNIAGPWSDIASVSAGADGTGKYSDARLTVRAVFYRSVYP